MAHGLHWLDRGGAIINRKLAAKDAAIVTPTAETGGPNAMVADATRCPEQVADDMVMSAFHPRGQRCRALWLLGA